MTSIYGFFPTGNAGFRLHFPAQFERVGDQGPLGERGGMERLNQQPQQPARSIEICIGQKLQLIGDQFHQEHVQVVRIPNVTDCTAQLKPTEQAYCTQRSAERETEQQKWLLYGHPLCSRLSVPCLFWLVSEHALAQCSDLSFYPPKT